MVLLFSTLFVVAESSDLTPKPINEKSLLGDWYFKDGAGAFETLSLEIEDGIRYFYSWLHEKPDSKGTWTLNGSTITFSSDSGDVVEWTIQKIANSELTILETGESQIAVYARTPTKGFGDGEE